MTGLTPKSLQERTVLQIDTAFGYRFGSLLRIAHVRPRCIRYARFAPIPNDKRPRLRGASWAKGATVNATTLRCGRICRARSSRSVPPFPWT
jgi:hypothetical protein